MFLIAHGISVRTDLPVPEWLFWWAAAVVLFASFVALASLWPEPRLAKPRWRPLPGGVGRVLASRPVEIACGAIGVFLFGLTVYAGFEGTQSTTANWAPIFVYVIFWLAFVPLSVLFGDVFRAFNPWRAIGRAVAWAVRRASRSELPEPLAYPGWLGRWPAAAGIFGFAALELVVAGGDKPETVAIAALVYSVLTFIGMALYGVERWMDRGEAFSVYFNLFSRLSPVETREREVGLRKPLSGLPQLEPLPGTVALVAVMIGSVSFAGFSARRLAREFAHTLVPIALAYVAAHYFTLLLFQGQAIVTLASDPLGNGSNVFGTADTQIDYTLIGADATWYWQVGFVVAGHVAALMLAHDRVLALYDDAKLAVRSQYWMLAVMVGFTSLALWLLSQGNA